MQINKGNASFDNRIDQIQDLIVCHNAKIVVIN